ncbi:M1 family metallopeptidase [Actinomycetes bacterium KLBMP 9797]
MRTRRLISSLACGVLLAAAGAAPADAGGGFRPGAPGLGDPYFPTYGNGGYDVRHYDLDIRYQPATDLLTGRATIRARATQNLSSFNLDFVGLTIDGLRVDGRPAAYFRAGQELTIQRTLRKGTSFTVEVRYHGVPVLFPIQFPRNTWPGGFIPTDDGAIIAGFPEVAASWYPVNDHPLDKASYSFAVTVPEGLAAIANGVPRGRSTVAGWTTWRWAQHTPMISYLATAAIGEFDVETTWRDGRPTVIAIDPDVPPGFARDAVRRTDEVTDFLVSQFGPYPFEANGAIVDDTRDLVFALELQTRPIYSLDFFAEVANTYVVAHEIAHQWFGDSIGMRHYDDIWLNEGFATYAEWLWGEHLGDFTPQQAFDYYYVEFADVPTIWSPPPGDPGPADLDLLGDSVYIRGAMTLQALRMTVGDDAFWRIIRGWYAAKRNGNGETAEFVALAERVSGQRLDALFDAWLFTDTRPAYPGVAAPVRPLQDLGGVLPRPRP